MITAVVGSVFATWIIAAAAASDDDRLRALEQRLDALESENAELKEAARRQQRRPAAFLEVGNGLRLRPRGYIDVGAFWAGGDGVAYARDPGGETSGALSSFPWLVPFPARGPPPVDDAAWVYTGDPWANAVNTQGDSANLGHDRSVIERFDPIQKSGGFSFLVNTVAFGVDGSLGTKLRFSTLLMFEPRNGALGAPGDVVSLPLAYLEWIPFDLTDLRFTVGKVTSTFGREYRAQFAPDRFGVTPSLLARYTIGNPVGVKARWRGFDGLISLSGALTNGGMDTERYGLFAGDVDTDLLPTASGRIATEGGVDAILLRYEIGVSGIAGMKDERADAQFVAWQLGVDAWMAIDDFTLELEYLRGESPRDARGLGTLVSVDGVSATGTLRATNIVGVFFRVDARRAILLTPPNLYVSDVARAAVGARLDLGYHVALKFEAMHIAEMFGPAIANDVVTSSAVLHF